MKAIVSVRIEYDEGDDAHDSVGDQITALKHAADVLADTKGTPPEASRVQPRVAENTLTFTGR